MRIISAFANIASRLTGPKMALQAVLQPQQPMSAFEREVAVKGLQQLIRGHEISFTGDGRRRVLPKQEAATLLELDETSYRETLKGLTAQLRDTRCGYTVRSMLNASGRVWDTVRPIALFGDTALPMLHDALQTLHQREIEGSADLLLDKRNAILCTLVRINTPRSIEMLTRQFGKKRIHHVLSRDPCARAAMGINYDYTNLRAAGLYQ